MGWLRLRIGLPPVRNVQGNGRLEADELDIDAKFAGRVARLLADKGDVVGLSPPTTVGKSSVLGLIAGGRQIGTGTVEVFGGNMADAHCRTDLRPKIVHLPRGWARPFVRT